MKPDSVARFTVRGSGKPECQKRATPKPHVDMYITPHYTDSSNGEGTPLANRYSLGRVYSTPKGHSPLLCFLTFNEIYQISNRQNQSVVNAFLIKSKFPPFTHTWLRLKELCKNRYFVVIIKAFSEEIKKETFRGGENKVILYLCISCS